MARGIRLEAASHEIPEGAVPMAVPVYVRLRNALRASERIVARRDPEAGFHDAETKSAVLRSILERAHVLPLGERAIVGSHLRVRYVDGDSARYELVVPTEVDTEAGRISFESPVGAALMGTRAGDEVEVVTPAGARRLQVRSVYHR